GGKAIPLWFMGRRRKYGYVFAVLAIMACTAMASLMQPYFQLPNIVMVYLAMVALVAFLAGRGPSILASVLAALAFDFFNVPPHFLLTNSDGQYLLTLGIMLSISLLISSLTSLLRDKVEESHRREQYTAMLYALTRELAATRGVEALAAVVARHLENVFQVAVKLLLPGAGGLRAVAGQLQDWSPEQAAAGWQAQDENAGWPLYLLPGTTGSVGLLLFAPGLPPEFLQPDRERLLRTMLSSAALALERAQYVEAVEAERVKVESERLKNSLLSAVSHDLRTPLATIVGASSSLVAEDVDLSAEEVAALHRLVFHSSMRMRSLVENILDMARLQSGPVNLRCEWQGLEEVLGVALQDLRPWLGKRRIVTRVPTDLPLLNFDPVLLQRVFVNLLENAVKYTPEAAVITITAEDCGSHVQVGVADNGPGLPVAEREAVFEKFYRGAGGRAGGAGLGLSICRAIIEAHGGRIAATSAAGGGACFVFSLPASPAPDVAVEEIP
ncbi:MAG TPA: ATP-binding protein, partial [Moraxellaceae bacterium]